MSTATAGLELSAKATRPGMALSALPVMKYTARSCRSARPRAGARTRWRPPDEHAAAAAAQCRGARTRPAQGFPRRFRESAAVVRSTPPRAGRCRRTGGRNRLCRPESAEGCRSFRCVGVGVRTRRYRNGPRHLADRVDTLVEDLPEGLGVGCTGESARHGHNGDRLIGAGGDGGGGGSAPRRDCSASPRTSSSR